VTVISRVQDKNELKITIANNGATSAEKAKVTICALPYGFYWTVGSSYYAEMEKSSLLNRTPAEHLSAMNTENTTIKSRLKLTPRKKPPNRTRTTIVLK